MDFRSEHMTRSGRLWSPLRGKEELKHFSSLNRGAFPIWSSCYRDAIWYENQPPVMNERSCDNEENARAWRIVQERRYISRTPVRDSGWRATVLPHSL